MAEERVIGDSFSAAGRGRLAAENDRLRQEQQDRYGLSNIVGNSRAMRLVCRQIGQIAQASADVLIRGEPGTGKTLIAGAIHHNSSRSRRPLVTLRCGGLPDGAVDAQLFGEPKGPTAAPAPPTGSLRRASGGTLLLHEVSGLGVQAQARLLTMVRDQVFERAARRQGRLDVRLIAATSANLEEGVTNGSFRRDLYERLGRLTVAVPPLRERKADLPMLIDLFVEKFAREHARRVGGFSMQAMDLLVGYDWPGNVRELSAAVERAVVRASGPVMHHHMLPPTIQEAARVGGAAPLGLAEALDAYERELLRDALRQTRGVRSKAARLLRTSERVFNYKLRKHGIDCREFVDGSP